MSAARGSYGASSTEEKKKRRKKEEKREIRWEKEEKI